MKVTKEVVTVAPADYWLRVRIEIVSGDGSELSGWARDVVQWRSRMERAVVELFGDVGGGTGASFDVVSFDESRGEGIIRVSRSGVRVLWGSLMMDGSVGKEGMRWGVE